MHSDRISGYQALAAAVIEQAVRDATQGTDARRKRAVAAIRAGQLAPWVDLLCERYDVYEGLMSRLCMLTRAGP